MSPTRAHLSIGEVLSLLQDEFPDVTISKIRFLESQGLLDPERTPSGYRKFYEDDIERLRWILLQQRENFLPLRVIKQRLETSAAAGLIVPPDDGPDDVPTGADLPDDGVTDDAGAGAATGPGRSTGAAGRALDGPAADAAPRPDAGVRRSGDGTSGDAAPGAVAAPAATPPSGAGAGTRTSPVPGWRLRVEQAAAEAAGSAAATAETGAVAGGTAGAGATRSANEPAIVPAIAPALPSGGAAVPAAVAAAVPGSTGDRRAGTGAGSPLDPGPSGVSLTREELAAAAGLDAPQLAELERFGLLRGRQVGAEIYFDGDALVVARGAAGFLRYGIEARHLRMYKVAAEREAGFYEQVILPLLKQRNPEGRRRAMEILAELSRLGEGLHDALLRASLADYAGS